jgi:NAD(P)H-hydrate epimerase
MKPLYTQEDDQGKSETIETFTPEALISLTVPKLGVRSFKGQHWLGGRFVPESVDSSTRRNSADIVVS